MDDVHIAVQIQIDRHIGVIMEDAVPIFILGQLRKTIQSDVVSLRDRCEQELSDQRFVVEIGEDQFLDRIRFPVRSVLRSGLFDHLQDEGHERIICLA